MVSWGDLRREPFRLFFPLGVLYGLLGADHWVAYALGWIPSYSGFYHASLQVGAYLACIIVGFLLTALPRFMAAPPATSAELATFLLLFLAYPVALSRGRWIAAEGCFLGILILLAVFAGRRVAARRTTTGPPTEFVWIPIGILHGVVGLGVLMLGQAGALPAWALAAGRPMVQQGFLLSMVLGVGGFMAPRLMGRSELLVTPAGISEERARRIRRSRIGRHAIAGLLLFLSFWVEGAGAVAWAYRLRAIIVTAELAWTTRFIRRPAVPDRYVQFLWVSLWMIVLGACGAAVAARFRVALLHLMFLGGFSLMSFAVATMVVLSHSGEGQRLRQPLWALRAVGIGLAVAVAARLSADAFPRSFFQLLALAAAAWSVAGVSWLMFAAPFLVRAASPEAFDRAHESAKRHVLKP